MHGRVQISIHTPLAGSDVFLFDGRVGLVDISIHTPLAGSDMAVELGVTIQVLFQSTLPLRGVTGVTFARRSFRFQSTLPLRGVTRRCRRFPSRWYFNPHSPCGERLGGVGLFQVDWLFQSTLPLRGATPSPRFLWRKKKFQSTLPLRGATQGCEG